MSKIFAILDLSFQQNVNFKDVYKYLNVYKLMSFNM